MPPALPPTSFLSGYSFPAKDEGGGGAGGLAKVEPLGPGKKALWGWQNEGRWLREAKGLLWSHAASGTWCKQGGLAAPALQGLPQPPLPCPRVGP